MPDSENRSESSVITPGALAKLMHPVRRTLIVGGVLAALSAVASMIPFIAVAEIGRALITHGIQDASAVWAWAIVGVAAALARLLLYGTATQMCHYADAEFRYVTRARLSRHLGALPLGWFRRNGSATVAKAVSQDVKRMHVIIAHTIGDVTSAVIAPLTAVVYMAIIDWRFTLLVVGYVIAVFLDVMPMMQRVYELYMDDYDRALSELADATVELADGIEVVKTYGERSHGMKRFDRAADQLTKIGLLWMSATGRGINAMNFLFSPAMLIVWITAVGMTFVSMGWMSVADVLPFLAVGVGLPTGILLLGQLLGAIRTAKVAATSVDRVLSEPSLPVPANPKSLSGYGVHFDDVTFGYDEGATVLRNISLRLEPGTVTALVGPSGSGKSTVAALIPRFWDVTAGAIRIGGTDIREIAPAELLAKIATVFQDVVLLRETIRDNIRLGRPSASHAEVEAAARAANIHERIIELPGGYDTLLGDQTVLSGGEKQRLTIARALLQDAPIVILDEATAHSDPENETKIQEALSVLARGRTVLVIAHRLRTISEADQIVVLHDGAVTESGTHDDLLRADGLYAHLWRAQEEGVPA